MVMENGYTGEILKIDLSSSIVTTLATSVYTDRFLGGRGVGAKIYWDLTPPGTKAFDPKNCLVFITGPVTGFMGLSGCRWQICGKSPHIEPGFFSYANVGGSWGAWLKYAGYDGLVVSGRAERPVYLYLDDRGKIEIRDAAHLWGKTSLDAQALLKNECGKDARIFTIGPAGENLVYYATAMTSDYSLAGGGLISDMGFKKLKAIVIQVAKKKKPVAARPDELKLLAKRAYDLKEQNWDPYPEFEANGKPTLCYGCIGGPGFCNRRTYMAESGSVFRNFCQAAVVYVEDALKYSPANAAKAYHLATQLCDNYGLDTMAMAPLLSWLKRCYRDGLISEAETGLPLSEIGSAAFITTLVRKISFREGFGDILADGLIRTAQFVGKGCEKLFGICGLLTRDGEKNDYDPRLIFTNALINATEPRKSIQLLHATAIPLRRWTEWHEKWDNACLSTEILGNIAEDYWGSRAAADFTTYEGKAMAAKKIQDYGYAKESAILCDFMWPIYEVRTMDDNLGCGKMESQILSAITGRELDQNELLKIGERVFNLQRMILLREGWDGRKGDNILDYLHEEPLQNTFFSAESLIPGKDGQVVSGKGTVVARQEFEKMKDDYYLLRGWDENGWPTKEKLVELGLGDIADQYDSRTDHRSK